MTSGEFAERLRLHFRCCETWRGVRCVQQFTLPRVLPLSVWAPTCAAETERASEQQNPSSREGEAAAREERNRQGPSKEIDKPARVSR